MSQSAVSRIWRAFGLKPHLVDTFKLSPDPLFVDKVRDVVGLYVNPPEGALVLCVDEKTQVQALDRTSPVLPLRPGLPERRTHDYAPRGHHEPRLAALDVASGHVIVDMTERHQGPRVPPVLEPDQPLGARAPRRSIWSSTTSPPTRHPRSNAGWFAIRDCHCGTVTPTYSSWINLIERWFAELTTKWLDAALTVRQKSSSASITRWVESSERRPQAIRAERAQSAR